MVSGVKKISLVVERKGRPIEPDSKQEGADRHCDAERDTAAGEDPRAALERDDLGQ